MDQVGAKGYGLLYRPIGQDDRQHESSSQVPTTGSQKHGTTLLQVQEMPT